MRKTVRENLVERIERRVCLVRGRLQSREEIRVVSSRKEKEIEGD